MDLIGNRYLQIIILSQFIYLLQFHLVTAQTGRLDAKCFGKPEGFKYTNPTNCAQFYHCSHGQSVLVDCAATTYFSEKIQRCDYPENVQCNGIPAEPDCSKADNDAVFANPNDCTTFYICSHGTAYLMRCQPLLSFDRFTLNCNWADLVLCPNAAKN